MEHISVPVSEKQSGCFADGRKTKEWAQFDLELSPLLRRSDELSKRRERKTDFFFCFVFVFSFFFTSTKGGRTGVVNRGATRGQQHHLQGVSRHHNYTVPDCLKRCCTEEKNKRQRKVIRGWRGWNEVLGKDLKWKCEGKEDDGINQKIMQNTKKGNKTGMGMFFFFLFKLK